MEIRKIKQTEMKDALKLVWETFLKFEAPEYTKEGIEEFKRCIEDKNWIEQREFIGAFEEENIVGVIATKDITHIALFFVDGKYHKQGVGAGLIHKLSEYLYCEMGQTSMTVNSSPYAVGFYHKLGFADTGSEQTLAGIVFTPMELII